MKRGRVGSVHVSLRVGGGEDVGGWELISWSLVSVQSLDASPRLAAASHAAPAPPHPSLTVAPHLPQNPRRPQLPTRDGRQSHLEASGAVCLVKARGEHRGPSGRKEVPTPRWLPRCPGWPADPAGEGPRKQPRSRGGEGPNPPRGARGAEPVCRPTPSPTRDSGSGPSGVSKFLGPPRQRRAVCLRVTLSSAPKMMGISAAPPINPQSQPYL